MVRVAGSLFVWLAWLVIVVTWTLLVALVFVATVWWDHRRWWAGRTFRAGSRLLVATNPWWDVAIEGDAPARDTEPFVAVCNHESMADIVLIGTLPFDMKWLSKAEIARIPFLGWMMLMAGDVIVRRNDRRSRGASYDQLREWLDRGASVMLFPEGTRTRTGDMLPFRNGAFRLSIESGRPIQPLAVSGGRAALHADSAWFGRARVTVRILPQVSPAGLQPEDVDDLRDRVRDMIEEARGRP